MATEIKASTVYGIIISVLLGITLIFWGVLLLQIWTHPTAADAPAYVAPVLLFWACGALLSALGSTTAAALGFTIQDLKVKTRANPDAKLSLAETAAVFTWPVLVAAVVYIVLGLLVFLTAAVPLGAGGFEALQVYAVTFIGWLAGAFTLLKPATA